MNSKIFVVYHNPGDILESPIYGHICVGDKKDSFNENFYRDDVGENIADKNPQYNELTAIYWVYKHIDQFKDIEYIGFSHYRRLFCLNKCDNTIYIKNELDKSLVSITDDSKINNFFKEYDFVTVYPSYYSSVYNHYGRSHNIKHLKKLIEIINRDYPEYKETADKYFHGHKDFLYNMFIFKKEDFMQYCEFLFQLLDKFINETDYKGRLFLSERITGLFIYNLIKQNKKPLYLPMFVVREKSFKNMNAELRANFQDANRTGFLFKFKPIWLFILSRRMEQRLRRHKHKRAKKYE